MQRQEAQGHGTWRLHAPATVRYVRSNEHFSTLAQLASTWSAAGPHPKQHPYNTRERPAEWWALGVTGAAA
jgi:hypothetical protein